MCLFVQEYVVFSPTIFSEPIRSVFLYPATDPSNVCIYDVSFLLWSLYPQHSDPPKIEYESEYSVDLLMFAFRLFKKFYFYISENFIYVDFYQL